MPTRRAALAGLAALAAAPAPARLVVAELFTSQGCSSCPPADALLRELAGRDDVLPLAFHVTYWNSLGWRDPFSLDLATARQRRYAAVLGTEVYTPQLVVDGRIDVVGSDRRGVAAALRQGASAAGPSIAARETNGTLEIDIAAAPGAGQVLVVGYDPEHETHVGRGENAGRALTEANIVRSLSQAGAWRGEALHFVVPRPEGVRLAVLLQAPTGAYLAAARVRAA